MHESNKLFILQQLNNCVKDIQTIDEDKDLSDFERLEKLELI